jgi:uncharacterized repeat protein (TIGR01451 family)
VRRCSLYTGVFLLAVALPGGNSRAVAPGAELPAPARPAPEQTGTLRVIASSEPEAGPAEPVTPVPGGGLRLQPAPIRLPAVTPGVQAVAATAPAGSEARVVQPAMAPPVQPSPPVTPADSGCGAAAPPPAAGRTASVYVEMGGPAVHVPGQPLAYEILVRNPGAETAARVRVEDDLPAGARCLRADPPAEVRGRQVVWQLGNLDAGGERHLRVEVDPADDEDCQGTVTASCSTAATTVRTHLTRPRLELTMTGPQSADVGDPVHFQLVVANTGSQPANHVVLHDRLPAGLHSAHGNDIEADIGTLAAGATRTVSLATTAVKGGRQLNEATVTADSGLRAEARATVEISAAALLVRHAGAQTGLHQEVDCRLEVVNPGQAPATNVTLADVLPAGLDFLAAGEGGAYRTATRTVQWSLGTLAPGASRAVALRLLARTPGDWVNAAVAHADHGLDAKAAAAVHVEGIPALMLKAVDLDDPVEVGAETSYEIRVANQGTGACHNVQVQATLPDGMAVLDAQGPAAHRIQGQQVTFDAVPDLAARAEAVFHVRVRAVRRGDWRLKVNLTCAELQRPVYAEESTCVYDGGGDDRRPAPTPPTPGTEQKINKRQL